MRSDRKRGSWVRKERKDKTRKRRSKEKIKQKTKK
jgi:hypothetical protein